MFRRKRAALVRQLWRSRVGGEGGCDGAGPELREGTEERGCGCLRGPTQEPRGPTQDLRQQKNQLKNLLKNLPEQSLESLLRSVHSQGGDPGDCVLLEAPDLNSDPDPNPDPDPVFLMCRTFRWSDLRPEERLKTLSFCQSHKHTQSSVCTILGPRSVHGSTVCMNPFHYSRLSGADSPSVAMETTPRPCPEPRPGLEPQPRPTQPQAPADTDPAASSPASSLASSPASSPASSLASSLGSSLGSSSGSLRSHWCSVAFWEQRTRVGRLYHAQEPSLCVFYHLPQGSGLCLDQLQPTAYSRGEPPRERPPGGAQQHRRRIGFGIVLSREGDGVWVYNRSRLPVFVHSPTLEPPGARGLTVERVLPGYSLKVFDYERSGWIKQSGVKPEPQKGPWDPNSIRISFAKGWGPCYSRQVITSCPCWLEVLLNTHR